MHNIFHRNSLRQQLSLSIQIPKQNDVTTPADNFRQLLRGRANVVAGKNYYLGVLRTHTDY